MCNYSNYNFTKQNIVQMHNKVTLILLNNIYYKYSITKDQIMFSKKNVWMCNKKYNIQNIINLKYF